MSIQIQNIQKSVPRSLKTSTDSTAFISNLHTVFKNSEPGKFCPRKLYEVVFANALTNQCCDLLNGIIKVHNAYKKDSNVVFITQRTVTNFIKAVVAGHENQPIEHPPQLMEHLLRVCKDLNDCLTRNSEVSRKQLALIMKHKLINEMYTQYAKDARIDHDMCQKEELLKRLQKGDVQKQIRFSQTGVPNTDLKSNTTKHKKIDSVSEFQMNDYTTYPLPDNLHGSDNLKDHVYFYVFVGFQDPCLLKLLMRYKVPVNCILQISRVKNPDSSELTYFWKKINEISENSEKFKQLEDAAPMRYVHEEVIPDAKKNRFNFFKERLKELEELLMNILDLKRKHIHYISHLHPYEFKDNDLKFGPFSTYEGNLRDIPSEYITIPFIIQSMLLEVEKTIVGTKQNTNVCKHPSSRNLCIPDKDGTQPSYEVCEIDDEPHPCPFSLKYFRTVKKREFYQRKQIFRKFYKGDVLNMHLVADKRAQPVAVSDGKSLMNQRFFHLIKLSRNLKDSDLSMPHIHHQGTPSSIKPILSKEQTNHFLNLLYLSSMKMVEEGSNFPEDPTKSYMCSPYDSLENNKFLPKSINSLKELSNWYHKFDSLLFRWKEPLSSSTLAQWLFEAEQEFAGANFKYCESTNTLVVYFHQDLKPPGTRTRIWKESLRTISCFRDFCSFYYAEEARWFSKSQPIRYTSHLTYVETEEKYVFERLIGSNELYKNYEKYLIPYQYCDNFDLKENSSCLKSENLKTFSHIPPVAKPNFVDIISEIKNYPSGKELRQHCSKSFSTSSLTAYNEKPQRFGLIGVTHEFFSHDGVQITVDTCRFYFEDFKLSVTLKFDNHILIGHCKNGHVDPHLILKDGTVVKLILPPAKHIKEIDSCTCSGDMDAIQSLFGSNQTTSKDHTEMLEGCDPTIEEMPTFTPEIKHVVPVWKEDLEEIDVDISLLWNKVQKIPYEKDVNRDIKILTFLKNTNVVHKYLDSRRQRYVKRKYKFLEVPYSTYIRRILNKPMKHKCTSVYRRRKIRVKDKSPRSNEETTPHIKLSLPNGLILESLTSNGNQEIIVIKQTHLHRESFKSIMYEDYRLFLDHGTVVIRYSNGNIRILDSQGTMLDFRQRQREEYDAEKCLKNIDTCRKMIYRISLSPNKFCHDIHGYSRTRRGHLTLSKELKLNSFPSKDISTLSMLYSSIRMLTPDGAELKIKDERVKKKQVAKVLREWDFLTGQMFLERTDGMVVWNRDNGDQIVIFPDGTKITKTVHVEKTPEFFSKKDEEGWVDVSHDYLYEHPLYCPIKYESRDKKTTVMLKQNVELNMSKKSTFISFAGKNELLIDSERICLKKFCPKCGSECKCEITLNSDGAGEESTQLLSCKDSYEKVFTSDFSGRCQINKNFIEDELNNQNCNHVLKRDYHKAFLINENMTGDYLWNENMIMREVEKIEEVSNEDPPKVVVEQFTDVGSDSVGITFTKNYYQSLNSKFLWVDYSSPILFPKLELNRGTEKNVTFQVCRRLFNILGEKETEALYGVVKKLLDEDKAQSGYHKI